MTDQWEQKDFVYAWDPGKRAHGYTQAQIKIEVWMHCQSEITKELQKWYDEGWMPVGEVGPSSIVLKPYSKWDATSAILLTVFTAGIGIIAAPFMRQNGVELVEFRLTMRRRKTV